MKKQINIQTKDNKSLYGYVWEPESYDKVIVLTHGMAEHIDRYEYFANRLNDNGFLVIGYNQRGHKYTSSKEDYGFMGDCDNFKILVSDLSDVIKYAKTNYPNKKYYTFGHSMGSFVNNRFLETFESENKIEKCVLCGTGRMPLLILSLGAFCCSIIKLFKGN